MIHAAPVPLFGATTRRVKKLYESAFPPEQRIPFWALKLRARMKGMDLVAYAEDGRFCGFSCQTVADDLAYVYYLAVEADLRGRGVGGKILALMKEAHASVPIALDIEARDRAAANARQREARRSFYLKNDFAASGHGFKDGGAFEILVCGEAPANPARYAVAIDRLAFGLTHTLIRPMDEVKAKKR